MHIVRERNERNGIGLWVKTRCREYWPGWWG